MVLSNSFASVDASADGLLPSRPWSESRAVELLADAKNMTAETEELAAHRDYEAQPADSMQPGSNHLHPGENEQRQKCCLLGTPYHITTRWSTGANAQVQLA